jgi:hypothetical protein
MEAAAFLSIESTLGDEPCNGYHVTQLDELWHEFSPAIEIFDFVFEELDTP